MPQEHGIDLLKTAINSGRTQMRSEILAKIWKLLEKAHEKNDFEAAKAFVDAYEIVRDMPIQIEDKPKEILEEIGNDG